MPLPFALDHINLWLVQDAEREEAGWAIIDTGIGNAETRALWEKLFERFQPIRRVILTHYHPDHAGNADWICQRFGPRYGFGLGGVATVLAGLYASSTLLRARTMRRRPPQRRGRARAP